MFAAQKTHYEQLNSVKQIMMLSAWGFTMVVVSFLFLYVDIYLTVYWELLRISCWAFFFWGSSFAS